MTKSFSNWTATIAVVGALTGLAPVFAEERAETFAVRRQVRSSNPELVALIARGTKRSPTFSDMVAIINASDGIVYVEPGNCGHGVRACFTSVTKAGATRILWVRVDLLSTDMNLIASIGHELRHTLEVLDNPTVTTNAAMYLFYQRQGVVRAIGSFETTAAIDAGRAVSAELQRYARRR